MQDTVLVTKERTTKAETQDLTALLSNESIHITFKHQQFQVIIERDPDEDKLRFYLLAGDQDEPHTSLEVDLKSWRK